MSTSKRAYSRGGCKECKRRKIRCPEDKPSCATCVRLGKVCSYPLPGERVPRVSIRALANKEIPLNDSPEPKAKKSNPKPLTIQMYSVDDFGAKKKKRRLRLDDDYLTNNFNTETNSPISGNNNGYLSNSKSANNNNNNGSNTTDNLMQQINSQMIPPIKPALSITQASESMLSTTSSSSLLGGLYNDDDLNLLASDLNNIVNDIMFTSNMPNTNDSLIDDNFFSPFNYPPQLPDLNDIPKHIPLDYIKLKTDDEKRYLAEFYHEFASQILPFGAFDKISGTYYNPVRDVILIYAAKEPFLLSAILSQGAKLSFQKTSKQSDHDNYGSYLSRCLRLLGPALSKNRDKSVKDDLTSNIESILITVLLLTSSNAMTEKLSWRPHLKGAKDIIIKATHSKIRSSKTLILCKIWFADFEILAGTSSHLGGTIKTDCDLDSVINFEDEFVKSVLEQFGLLQGGSFNIMSGYNIQMIYLFRDLSKLLNRKREMGEQFVPNQSLEYIRLISGFYEHYGKVYIDRKCLLPGPISTPLTELYNLVDSVPTTSGNTLYISWMDISQQAYALAGLITVFTSILLDPPDLPHIQDLNSKLVDLIKNKLYYQESTASDWKFFKICIELGSVSAEITLKRIKKIWELREKGEEYYDLHIKHENGEIDGIHIDNVAY
ncbi:Fungal specific transcription factor domain family protein [Candida albicans]|uniref:Fungal specific transcription factor domain family protein n=1 Tax=Candida albicans TaxID=5476 RepID=A0A8H6F0Y9_CANAX|nr:Fungal specific transcription factor domain family protein [Candida albicans]